MQIYLPPFKCDIQSYWDELNCVFLQHWCKHKITWTTCIARFLVKHAFHHWIILPDSISQTLVLSKHVSPKLSEEENTKSEVCFSQTGFAACSGEQRDVWATGHVGRCVELSTAASADVFSSPSEPLCSLSITCAMLWAITTVYSILDTPHIFCVNTAHKLFVPKMEVRIVCL